MDEDDWASDGEDGGGLGDIDALPEVQLPEITPKPLPESAPASAPSPTPNAWASPVQSGDVRASLARAQTQFHSQSPNQPAHAQQQSGRGSFGNPSAFSSLHSPNSHTGPTPARSRPLPSVRAGPALFVSSLPFETKEADITDFFEQEQMPPVAVRLLRHNDNGNVFAAVVTLRPDVSVPHALSLNGRHFHGRSINVRLDGEREGGRRRNHHHNHHNHNSNYNNNYNNNFNNHGFQNHDRAQNDRFSNSQPPGIHGRGSGGGLAGRHDRMSNSRPHAQGRGPGATGPLHNSSNDGGGGGAHPMGNQTGQHHQQQQQQQQPQRGGDRRPHENGRPMRPAGRESNMAQDPSIPTGPIPSGRKKLQLKPRTKPMPRLEVDQRAIDGPRPGATAVSPPLPPGIRKDIHSAREDIRAVAPPLPRAAATAAIAGNRPEGGGGGDGGGDGGATEIATGVEKDRAGIEPAATVAAADVDTGGSGEGAAADRPVAVGNRGGASVAPVGDRGVAVGDRQATGERRPGSERYRASRPTADRDRFTAVRGRQDRSLSRRRGQKGGGHEHRRTPSAQGDRTGRAERNGKGGGRNGLNERGGGGTGGGGSWVNAKGGSSFRAAVSQPVVEKKEDKVQQKHKSANPFSALEDHVDDDGAES